MITKDQVIEVLKKVEDPELFLDIWFLGLIYNIQIEEFSSEKEKEAARVAIEMTFTSPMCPAGPEIVEAVRSGIQALPGVAEVKVVVTFTPPWTPSDEVKGMLGMM
jgi:metal-sulfur cluster biosynthetic enzyme